jgi:hypothetical protein
MRDGILIEDIEEMRRQQGIEDVELREQIRGLRVGDLVKLTLLASGAAGETLAVRVTSIRASAFRGKLVKCPGLAGLSGLRAGFPLAFTAAHIHSVVKRAPGLDAGT